MSQEALLGIAILLVITLLVRIIPAFVSLPLDPRTMERVEAVLPVAVLINLAVFSAASEAESAPLPAGAGLLVLFGLFIVLPRLPIIVLVLLASAAYLLVPAG